MAAKKTYHVYVIELSRKAWSASEKLRAANPQYNGMLESLYVGMTSTSPQERFEQHKSGYISNKGHKISNTLVEKYGLYLRPSLYNQYNPMTRSEAIKKEEALALELKRKGYAVWWN